MKQTTFCIRWSFLSFFVSSHLETILEVECQMHTDNDSWLVNKTNI